MGADIPYPERCWDAPFSSPGTPAPPWDAAAAPLRRPISPLHILAYRQLSKCKNESYYFAFIISIFFSLSTTTKGLCSKSCLEADFLKLCDAVTVKPLVTRYTTHKSTAAEYICGCAFVFSCSLLSGLDMERQHISRSYMGYLICHHSGSLPCRYVGIPTAVVSGLTLNMAFSIYLPYRFSAIYFSAMWTATAPSATAVTT